MNDPVDPLDAAAAADSSDAAAVGAGPPRQDRERPSVAIRPLEDQVDFAACVRLQKLVWGEDFDECVPTAILRVASRFGGAVGGAFAPGDAGLVGFVFGLTGIEAGTPIHWSDMLAVHPAWRGQGIGLALKAWQRSHLLALGVREMRWSFDPLEARNARLNLNRLGAVGRWYIEDMYGASRSPLHVGVGTDRLLVSWRLDEGPAEARSGEEPPPGNRGLHGESGGPPLVRVPIPRDLQALKREDPAGARAWRRRVREALQPLLAQGGVVTGFEDALPPADPVLLVRPPLLPSPSPPLRPRP